MLSPSQNSYNERLAEKLKRQADKRGADSPAAAELKHVQPAGGVSAKNAKGEAEKQAQEKK